MSRHCERRGGLRAARRATAALALALSTPAFADAIALVHDDGAPRVFNVTDATRREPNLGGRQEDELEDAVTRADLGDSSDDRQGGRDRQDQPGRPDGGANTVPELVAIRPFQDHVTRAAKAHNLDPDLLHAVISVESNYNVNAVSPKGAIGLMQLMPGTGLRYGVSARDLRQPEGNLRAGSRYLAELLQRFGFDLDLALAGYNAGEYAVIRHGMRVPPYAETREYVLRVLGAYKRLSAR